jgi:hypothetical protein
MVKRKIERIYIAGIRSGALAGILYVAIWSLYLTIGLIVISKSIFSAYFLMPFLVIGIPIGLFVGIVYGLIISIATKRFQIIEYVPRIGLILGVFTGIFYPLILALTGADTLSELIVAFTGGVVAGGISGWFGGKRFSQSLVEQTS